MQTLTIDNLLQGGLRDYTRNLMEPDQFYAAELNKPRRFTFTLQDLAETDFVVPTRGSYVTFMDDRWESRDTGAPDGILFTGYVSDDPKPVLLGMRNGAKVWCYEVTATSEDYLPQIKELPVKTYVNKTRGFIIRDVLATMFRSMAVPPLDTTGVLEGGIERLFQTERTKKFADLVADFAKADNYRYHVLNGRIFYEPQAEELPASSDPAQKLIIDEEDPRYTNAGLQLERVATSIANDITVFGEEEPTTLVNERYVSDGYQGEHQLLFPPYGVTEKILIQDDFSAPTFDSAVWEEVDDELALTGAGDGSYLQLFEGSFNIVGGPGPANPDFDEYYYLRSRKGIELSGIIEFRDGEWFFPPAATGGGVVGGLFTQEDMFFSNCFSGWWMDMGGAAGIVQPLINGNVIGANPQAATVKILNLDFHYILRRRFEFDIPVGLPVLRRGPLGTDIVFGEVNRVNGCYVTYTVEEIDTTDPENVVTTKTDLYTARIENVPEFVLYAPVVTFDLHAVCNFVKVHRPQQVRVEVDGVGIRLGDFIDGGFATIRKEENRATLNWYAVPTGVEVPPDIIVGAGTPYALWRLGDASNYVADTGATQVYPMLQNGGVSNVTGAPGTNDQAKHFDGTGFMSGPYPGGGTFAGGFPVPFSITAWIRTSAATGAIFSNVPIGTSGHLGFAISNGRLMAILEYPESALISSYPINDGQWHHVAWTHDATVFTPGASILYIDGVASGTSTQIYGTPQIGGAWYIGFDNSYWTSLGGVNIASVMVGDLDEVAIWNSALSPEQVRGLFVTSTSSGGGGNGGVPSPAYNPQTGVTIPPQGSIIDITYYRAEKSKARVKNNTSILNERAKFGDDGIRQLTVLDDEVFPVPRTSEECQYYAQAVLADRTEHRYEGTYTFETGERDVTLLTCFPAPGDLIPVDITLPNNERILANLPCTQVESRFIGEGAYQITLSFGPINRFEEAQRKLMLARKSSLDSPEIREQDIMVAEVLDGVGYEFPDNPRDMFISNVTPTTFTVNMNPARVPVLGGYGSGGGEEVNGTLPAGVVGYEVRRDESGFGQGNYVARVASATVTLARGARDKAYFIRPFNNNNVYSRNSAVVRVIAPLSNNIVATGLDGDQDSQRARLFIPLRRNPDIGGFLVRKDNADGAVLYHGDGVTHRSVVAGATVIVESNQISLTVPNNGALTVYVLVYNLLNEFGPGTTFTITRAAPTT